MKDMDISALLEQWAVCTGQRQGDLQAYTNMQSQSGALEIETQRFTAKTAAVKRATEKTATEKTATEDWATAKLGNGKIWQRKIRG